MQIRIKYQQGLWFAYCGESENPNMWGHELSQLINQIKWYCGTKRNPSIRNLFNPYLEKE